MDYMDNKNLFVLVALKINLCWRIGLLEYWALDQREQNLNGCCFFQYSSTPIFHSYGSDEFFIN